MAMCRTIRLSLAMCRYLQAISGYVSFFRGYQWLCVDLYRISVCMCRSLRPSLVICRYLQAISSYESFSTGYQ